jgi:hypothetical protein
MAARENPFRAFAEEKTVQPCVRAEREVLRRHACDQTENTAVCLWREPDGRGAAGTSRRGTTHTQTLTGGSFLTLFLLDTLVNFFTVDGHVLRGIDTDADLVAFDAQDGDRDVVTDDQGFANAAGKNKHCSLS